MHELDRADVEPARRLRGDQDLRVAVDLAGEDDLLLVAAGEAGRRASVGPPPRTSNSSISRRGTLDQARGESQPNRESGWLR